MFLKIVLFVGLHHNRYHYTTTLPGPLASTQFLDFVALVVEEGK
jgi:hypothetical protein